MKRMRNVSDESCRENKNTPFMFENFFSKIVVFMRLCGKIGTARGAIDNTDHARCVPDN